MSFVSVSGLSLSLIAFDGTTVHWDQTREPLQAEAPAEGAAAAAPQRRHGEIGTRI